jgi:hypothetical protein
MKNSIGNAPTFDPESGETLAVIDPPPKDSRRLDAGQIWSAIIAPPITIHAR